MTKQALIIIDIQNDYFKGGNMELFKPEAALENVLKLEQRFKKDNQPILYIQHINEDSNAGFFIEGTEGVELRKELNPSEKDDIIVKHYPNSFLDTNLQSKLKELDAEQLVICGMMTHMCIDSTTRAAAELGYQPILIEDATATRSLEYSENKVNAEQVQTIFIAALQAFAQVESTNTFLK
ncbi:cysteine hydrolase family protein [Staphylococcus carnosus]|uniref:cysteine hydrolase family protein n=1 Tax=Staphylococcus carnosus TaxID=1281 RepID=UPI0020A41D78|nr:cysteine hydrolase family protein [Staphylococcus carnosus]UTB80152.1 isochorismatase [Staphylococcus carnosus]